jgi:hypothetical protein
MVGVHTRLTDEVEPWKVRRTLEMVREMGSPWIVEFFPWTYIEPYQGEFRWAHADMIVEHARAQGLTVIARLGLAPEWARPHDQGQQTTWNYLDESGYDDLGNFVFEFVAFQRPRPRHHRLERAQPHFRVGLSPGGPGGLCRPVARRLSARQAG